MQWKASSHILSRDFSFLTVAMLTAVSVYAAEISPKKTTEKVDSYIQETHIKKQSEDDANPYINTRMSAPKSSKAIKNPKEPNTETTGVVLEEYHPHNSKEDLLRAPSIPVRKTRTEEIIEGTVQRKRATPQVDERYEQEVAREAYVRQLKENARKDGIELEISADNQVTGYRRQKPQRTQPSSQPRRETSSTSR